MGTSFYEYQPDKYNFGNVISKVPLKKRGGELITVIKHLKLPP